MFISQGLIIIFYHIYLNAPSKRTFKRIASGLSRGVFHCPTPKILWQISCRFPPKGVIWASKALVLCNFSSEFSRGLDISLPPNPDVVRVFQPFSTKLEGFHAPHTPRLVAIFQWNLTRGCILHCLFASDFYGTAERYLNNSCVFSMPSLLLSVETGFRTSGGSCDGRVETVLCK